MTAPADQSVRAFVEALASAAPSPGAGAAGALALALAAACARKAIAITERRGAGDAGLSAADARLARIAEGALAGAAADAALFAELIHALARHEDPRPAAAELADEGQRLVALARELSRTVGEIRGRIDPVMEGDVEASLALAEAFTAIQLGNLAETARLANSP